MTDEAESTALAPIPKESALAVLTSAEQFDAFFERVAKEVRGIPVDLTTSAGRKAVAATAFKVTKSKTAIMDAADLLTEDARNQIKQVNESKKAIAERLEALKVEVRKPLTDWEAAEERREELVTIGLQALRDAAVIRADETALQIEERLTALLDVRLSQDDYRDSYGIAMNLREHAITALTEGKARAVQAEADAAELATLREQRATQLREDEARRDREEQERIEREATETREREEREEQERREQAERERIEREEQEARDRQAEEDARAEREAEARSLAAANAAEEARQEADARHAAELAAEQEKTRAAETERQRLADEAAERDRLAQAESDAAAARAKDRAHKSKTMAAARDAMLTVVTEGQGEQPDEDTTRLLSAAFTTIVRAIVAGEIPAVTLAF